MEGQWEISAIQVPKLEDPVGEIIKNKLSCHAQNILSTKYRKVEKNEIVLL